MLLLLLPATVGWRGGSVVDDHLLRSIVWEMAPSLECGEMRKRNSFELYPCVSRKLEMLMFFFFRSGDTPLFRFSFSFSLAYNEKEKTEK